MMKRIIATLPHMMLFGALFAIMGFLVPYTYYNYFDNTQYYKVISPVKVEQREYKACEKIDAYIDRESLIDGHGDSIINLTLIREDETGIKSDRITSVYREITMTRGKGVVVTHWTLPCDVRPGKYYYDGVVQYEVRGIKKYTAFTTEVFEVYPGEVE